MFLRHGGQIIPVRLYTRNQLVNRRRRNLVVFVVITIRSRPVARPLHAHRMETYRGELAVVNRAFGSVAKLYQSRSA